MNEIFCGYSIDDAYNFDASRASEANRLFGKPCIHENRICIHTIVFAINSEQTELIGGAR